MDFTGTRQHPEPAAPAGAAAHHGQPALLGAGDARRRLPLRPRLGARARALRRRPARLLLRHHRPGPGALAGEAHRRALGHRQRRLPGRQLPARLERVERQVPRHACAPTGRATAASSASSRAASPAPPTSTRRAAASPTPASTSSPPTTASRSRTWSATTRSTTRPTARTTATAHNDNRSWNCGVEGPTDDAAISALRARQKRNLMATLLLSQGVPMVLGGR